MFTGLIEATGQIDRTEPSAAGRRVRIASPLGVELAAGDSVSVSGVCLTVTSMDAAGFSVDVSPETLRVTTLGKWTAGQIVNLERPLRADARLGGHFVLGHVDGVGHVSALRHDGDCDWFDITFPRDMAAWLIHKGSIAVDGISLTVASLVDDRFGVQILPFTRAHTTLRSVGVGDEVNLEADLLGKYVARAQALATGFVAAGGRHS